MSIKTKITLWLAKIFCKHERKDFCGNIAIDMDDRHMFTVGGWQCNKCGKSKLDFFYYS